MNNNNNPQYDAIIVGSGTCGATIARQLSKQNKKVLILEQGGNAPLKESFWGIASIADEVHLGGKLKSLRANSVGGSTGLYFGVVNFPNIAAFNALGIDLTESLEAIQNELPIAPLADELLGPQTMKLQKCAQELGYDWQKNPMLIDQSKCTSGYNNDARWRARSFVEEAVADGAQLITRATVQKVLVDQNQATGVQYKVKKGTFGSETCQAFGTKIILCAGSAASPKLLRDCGVSNVAHRGFYCDPGYAIFGLVPDLQATDNFLGGMSCAVEPGIDLGDVNMSRTFYHLMMLGSFKFKHLMNFSQGMGIGVKVQDSMGGELLENGRLFKELDKDAWAKLKKGEDAALKILKQAGATHIFNPGITSAGHVGGMIGIGEHVDTNLETQFKNLHVCDGSVLPETSRGTPTVPLLCLARYTATQLLKAL